MKKITFLFSLLLFVTFAAGSHTASTSNIPTPITLPIESVKSTGSVVPQSLAKDKIDLLEKELDNIIATTRAKGISASVAIPDKGIWCAARGITGNTSKEEITSDLQFYAGSIGKIFTAIVILRLAEEGRLSLESVVAKWFPEISWAGHITVDHLLTHTSGIPSFDNLEDYESNKYRYRNPEQIISFVAKKKLLFEPGAHYAYSNTGYLLLGVIIERVTGRSYKETVEHHIINKINLHKTALITSRQAQESCCQRPSQWECFGRNRELCCTLCCWFNCCHTEGFDHIFPDTHERKAFVTR